MAYLLSAAAPDLGHGISPVGLSLLQFALIPGPNIPGTYAVLLFTALDFVPSPVTSTAGCCFRFGFGFVSSVFLELVLH